MAKAFGNVEVDTHHGQPLLRKPSPLTGLAPVTDSRRSRQQGRSRCRADFWRGRVQHGVPRREVDARRQVDANLRRHQPDSAPGDCARVAQRIEPRPSRSRLRSARPPCFSLWNRQLLELAVISPAWVQFPSGGSLIDSCAFRISPAALLTIGRWTVGRRRTPAFSPHASSRGTSRGYEAGGARLSPPWSPR